LIGRFFLISNQARFGSSFKVIQRFFEIYLVQSLYSASSKNGFCFWQNLPIKV